MQPGTALASLVLLRHGETTWNQLRLVQGHNDEATLTERGTRQALEAAASLAGTAFDVIITSDLRRARDTAAIVGRGRSVDIVTTPALRERSYGVYEGGALDAVPVSLAGFVDDLVVDADARPEGGESLNDLYQRVGTWIEQLRRDFHGARILVVTHGGTVRALRAYCAATPFAHTSWYPVDNASVWTTDACDRPLA